MSASSTETEVVAEAEGNGLEISLRARFLNLHTLISFALAFAIIVFGLTRLDIDVADLTAQIGRSNLFLYGLAYLVYYATFPLRGLRWRLLLNNAGLNAERGVHLPSIWGLAELILLSWFANCIVPAKLGDAYRVYLLRKNYGANFSRTAGTVLAERMVDMVVLFLLLVVSAVGVMGQGSGSTTLAILGGGLGLTTVIVLGLVVMRHFGHRVEPLLPKRLRPVYGRLVDGTLSSLRQLPLLAGLTVVVWLFEAGRLFLVSNALGLTLGPPTIIFVALAGSLLTVLPITPGGLGLVEAGVVGLLMLTVSREQAISVAILDRSISYWSILVIGLVTLLLSRKK